MAIESKITTLYTPDVPRVLNASYRIGSAEDRHLIDAQILGAQTHLANSLIRGQIGSNFQLSHSSAALTPGDVFCAAPEEAIESGTTVRRVTKATPLALAAAGVALGVAVAAASPGGWFRAAMEGIVGREVTGLATGNEGYVRVGTNARAERVASHAAGEYPLGYVDGYGNLSMARGRAVGAGGGSSGYTTIMDEGVPQTARSTMDFVGGGVDVTDVGGVTRITINSGPAGSAVGQTQIWNGSAWTAGALDLADADARNGVLPAANGGTGVAGAGGTANRVLTTTNGTTWAAGLVALATMVSGLLPVANLADGSATSVLGRSAGTAGAQASIAAVTDGHTLRRAGGVLDFGPLDLSDPDATTGTLPIGAFAGGTAVGQVLRNTAGNIPAWGAVDLADPDAVTGLLPFANVASLNGLSVFGRAANTSGVMAAITGTNGQALRVSGTTLGFGTLATAAYADASVTLAKLANAGASSVLGRSAATAGVYADILSTADGQVLRRGAGGVIAFGAVDLADPDAVTGLLPFGNFADGLALSVFGRASNTSGAMASIVGAADQVLVVNTAASALAFGQVQTGGIANSAITLPKLADGAASSVIGRSPATGGAYADIVSTADGQVLRRGASGVIGWGAVDLADSDAVAGLLAFSNIANGSALSVFGRASNSAGVMASIVAGSDGVVLRRSGTTLGFGALTTASYADGSITLAKLGNGTAASVLGRSAATGGVYADIVSTADGQVFRRAGGVVGWGPLDLSDPDAVTNQLPGANVVPAFGAQTISNSGVAITSAAVRFASTVASPSITQDPNTGIGVVGQPMLWQAQSTTGATGVNIGGALTVAAGDSTVSFSGSGGDILLRSGIGIVNTESGTWTAAIGPRPFLVYPGDAGPISSTGILRLPHGATVLTGRTTALGSTELLSWGLAPDELVLGGLGIVTRIGNVADASVDTDGLANRIKMSVNGAEIFRGEDLGGAINATRLLSSCVQLFGSSSDSLTGDKVVLIGANQTQPGTTPATGAQFIWSDSSGLRSLNEHLGSWTFAPVTHLRRAAYSSFVETSAPALTTILSIPTSALGANTSGILEVYVTCVDTIGKQAQKWTVDVKHQSTVLSVGTPVLTGGGTAQGTVSIVASGTNILVRVTPANATNYRWDALAELTYGYLTNAAA